MLIINPGTGSVAGATADVAVVNLKEFLEDMATNDVTWEGPTGEHAGRFTFILQRRGRTCDVDMPGIPVPEAWSKPWDFPRLYVDGSSWEWGVAVDIARDYLIRKDADHE